MNTAFWILAWLSFSGSLFSEPHGQTTVSGELSVNRAVQVSSSAQTAATANTSVRYALWSQVLASSDADTTHLSAVYPVTSDIALSSDLSSCYLSRFSPVESSASGSSLVSGRVTVNPVNIDNLSVLGSSSVDVVLERRIGLLAEDITCSSSLVGEILPDIGIPGGEAIGRSDLIADLHLRTAIWCTSSSVSDVTGRLTVNAVDVGGDSVGASQVDADLSRRFLVDGDVIVGSTLFQVDNPDIQRTIRMSGDPVNGVALVSGTLNRFGAAFSQLYPKSQFSGTLSVRWALWSFLTAAPLSNTRLENTYLSVRWETSVSIVDPKTGIDAWAATKFAAESDILGSSVVYAEKMTLNPLWFTGLDVFGSTWLDADGAADRRLPFDAIIGSSQLSTHLNRFGACWGTLNPRASAYAHINRRFACWVNPQSVSSVWGLLNVARSVECQVLGSTSVVSDRIRQRNVESSSAGDTTLTGHITVNPKAITDGISQPRSQVYGDLNAWIAVSGSSSGGSDLYGEAYRKRNLDAVVHGRSQLQANLSAKYALWSLIECKTAGFYHLSRRFYFQDATLPGLTSVSVYLSAVRPFSGLSTGGRTSIFAVAYRKRNAVADLIFGYSVVFSHLTVNARVIEGQVIDSSSSVYGDILPYRLLLGSCSGVSGLSVEPNFIRAVHVLPLCSSDCRALLSAWYALWVRSRGITQGSYHLSRRFYFGDTLLQTNTHVYARLSRKFTAYADDIVGSSFTGSNLNVIYEVTSSPVDLSTDLTGRLTVNPVEIDGSCYTFSVVSADLKSQIAIDSTVSGSSDAFAHMNAKRDVSSDVFGSSSPGVVLNAWFNLPGKSVGYTGAISVLNLYYAVWASSSGDTDATSSLGVKRSVQSTVYGDTDLRGRLIRARFLDASVSGLSQVTGRLVLNPVDIDVQVTGASDIIAYLSAVRPIKASVSCGSGVTAFLGRNVELEAIIYANYNVYDWMENDQDYLDLLRVNRHLCNRTFILRHQQFLSVTRPLDVSATEGRSVVSGYLTINAKELSSSLYGTTLVDAHLKEEDRMLVTVSGYTNLISYLSVRKPVTAGCICSSSVLCVLNANYSLSGSIFGSSSLTGRVLVLRSMPLVRVNGTSVVSGALSSDGSITSYIFTHTSVYGWISRKWALECTVVSASSVRGYLSLRRAIYDGDERGVFSQTGGLNRIALVSEDISAELPDWLPVRRDEFSLFSALVESLRLFLSERVCFECTPLAMDPRHFVSVWSCSLPVKPSAVRHYVYGYRILEAASWYDLMHSPVPKWWWQDGRLYVSRLAFLMESVVIEPDRFRVATAVDADPRQPVYLLWVLPRCDVAYLVPPGRLRWSNGRLVSIVPKFGYLIHARTDLQLGASYSNLYVSAKANVWLTFQSSSGGDFRPECAPVAVNLVRLGFISVVVHSDTVRLDAVLGEPVVHRAEGYLSSCSGERGALVGVFVGDTPPSSVEPSPDVYEPAVGQVFVIRSGARYFVPSGATRFMLGILHDGAYRFGFGHMFVTLHQYGRDGALSVVYTDPSRLLADHQVEVDGEVRTLHAQSVESRFTMWMRALGHPLSFRGWNGYDYMSYLRGVGFRFPLIPGIPPVVSRWSVSGALVFRGMSPNIRYRVDVPGVPQTVVWSGVPASSHLPYYPDGNIYVDNRPASRPVVGQPLSMRVRFWSYSQSGDVVTVSPSPHTSMIAGDMLAGLCPYEVVSVGYGVRPGVSDVTVFVWEDSVS